MDHITWFICLILQTSCHISDKMAANLILSVGPGQNIPTVLLLAVGHMTF